MSRVVDISVALNVKSSDYDDSEIRSLFENYYTTLVLFADNYLENVEQSKDVVQDVFFALVENKDRFSSIENLKAYLYQAVKNRCFKQLRHIDVRERHLIAARLNNETQEIFLEKMLEHEVLSLLTAAIETLPDQCRAVFRLSMDGKSNQEIADILNIAVETVKSHKKAGKKILSTKLKGVMDIALILVYFS